MRHTHRAVLLAAALLFVICLGGGPAPGAELYIYPNKGQSSEQQSRDRYDCHTWAVQQTGYDPTKTQTVQSSSPPPPGGGVFRGAARGAAVGAVGGAIAGDAGTGAAVGAATGGLIGGMRQRDKTQQQQQAQAQKSTQQSAAASDYNRALGACLTGRGYTVQ